tara:strand:- start:44846 stop:45523 length:678 start_codon:yes stop_codon:yes gene_type:complete
VGSFIIAIYRFFMSVVLQNIENELKLRHNYPYKWFRKQNDVWDRKTNFIYQTTHWQSLLLKISSIAKNEKFNEQQLFQYTANRWYNFWSAKAVEYIFSDLHPVSPVLNTKDAKKDFYLFGIPFDHKTSVFPKGFNRSLAYAQKHRSKLIEWFFNNQSTQRRHHFKNRLFIVVYAQNGEHWKLKAEISLLKKAIEKYVKTFRREQLHSFTFADDQKTLSDIIWVIK